MRAVHENARAVTRAGMGKAHDVANYPESCKKRQARNYAFLVPGGYHDLGNAPKCANTPAHEACNGTFRGLPHPRLTGDRNQCPTCNELLNSTTAFEKHRTGTFEPDERRCLSVAEMQARGFTKPDGFWRAPASQADRERLARLATLRRRI